MSTATRSWTPASFANLELAVEKRRRIADFFTRTRLIVVGFVVLSAFFVAALVAAIVFGTNRNNTTDSGGGSIIPEKNDTTALPCLTRGCISAANHQLRSIDSSAYENRCTDFFSYACGGWRQTHPIQSFDVERTIISDILNQRDNDIDRLLDSPIIRLGETSWEFKLKTYYRECLDDYARLPNSGKQMLSVIEDPDTINGWFLIDNNASDASQDFLLKNQTVYEQLAHIHGDLGVLTFFGIRVRFQENDPTAKRLEFYPAGLTMEVEDYLGGADSGKARKSAFEDYVIAVLQLLAADAGVDDDNLYDREFTINDDILAVETIIAETIKKYPVSSTDSPISMTLGSMSDEYAFDFVELMSHELSDPTLVSRSTVVYVTNPSYFQAIFQILSIESNLTLNRMIHNYMRWRLVHTYIEDLSYTYVTEHRQFIEKYFGYPLHSTNEQYCTREVLQRFPLAIFRLYTRDSSIFPNATETIGTMIRVLKDSFKQYIEQYSTWIPDNPTKSIAKGKIDALTAAIGYASIASDDDQLDQYYQQFQVDMTSHFQNAYMYHRFRAWAMANSLAYPDQLDHWDFFETRPNRLFDYIAIFNRLFVVASALRDPLVNPQWPWAMNIGSLGVLLSQNIFDSFVGPQGRTYAADGKRIPDWWSAATIQAYNNSRQCITNYYVRDVKTVSYYVNEIEIVVTLAGEPFSPTTLRDIGALRVAYQTLKNDQQTQSFQMPGTNFTAEQTFFLAYAQTQCFQRQDLVQLLRTRLGNYDEAIALNAALSQMPEFQSAFQCPIRANPCF